MLYNSVGSVNPLPWVHYDTWSRCNLAPIVRCRSKRGIIMKTKRYLPLFYSIVMICLFLTSCKRSNTPTNPTEQVHVSMEIISYQDAPFAVDSNLCYIENFIEWNATGWRDTIKCDSLAKWFANSKYQITDLWFPNTDSRCESPINTENTVTLKLIAPDSSLRYQGYSKTSTVVSGCYNTYRHYIYSRN